jgi:type III restriction enzyme
VQYLRTGQAEALGVGKGSVEEARLEDYIVSGLVDFDDVAYDEHADLLYELAGQTVQHFCRYLSEDEVRKVLRLHQRELARFIHVQMQHHYWEEAVGYEVKISKGFTELKQSAYTASADEPPLNFRHSPADKSNMAKYIFGGFTRCLYPVQKFHSDSERKLAVILERESLKWFRPAKGQFQIFYHWDGDHREYQPDFVAETEDCIYMLEPKARKEMDMGEVQTKKDAAVRWCDHATDYALKNGGKPWKYLLIPHDIITENMTIAWLAQSFLAS